MPTIEAKAKGPGMLIIDGSFGEGGGQILRSALALSIVTQTPCRIENIRAKRQKSGLLRQHLTAVRAATQISAARTLGAELGATQLEFYPQRVSGGDYRFSIGTAGSTTLVLQTIVLPLVLATEPSTVVVEGGTHNPSAPPFEFLERVYLPLLNRMGPQVTATLLRPGFFPAGGGAVELRITPVQALQGLTLMERGTLHRRCAQAIVSKLPQTVAERELNVLRKRLRWSGDEMRAVAVQQALGPGNIVMAELHYEHLSEMFSRCGEVGRSAERVATDVVQQCQRYLKAAAPVGEHLTDQLMLPLAVAGSGSFRSTGLSQHAETHRALIQKFLDVRIVAQPGSDGDVIVTVERDRGP